MVCRMDTARKLKDRCGGKRMLIQPKTYVFSDLEARRTGIHINLSKIVHNILNLKKSLLRSK